MGPVGWANGAIFTDLTCHNTLRKANGLPLRDLRTEDAHQMWLAKREEYWAACDGHADERDAIRRQALVEFRAKYGSDFPSTTEAARQLGWTVVAVSYGAEGISGTKGCHKRPGLDAAQGRGPPRVRHRGCARPLPAPAGARTR